MPSQLRANRIPCGAAPHHSLAPSRSAIPLPCYALRLGAVPMPCFAVLGCALAVLSKPFPCVTIPRLCGSLSGCTSRRRRGVFQRSADHIRGRLCFSWAVRCFALLFLAGACRCLYKANSCCAQQSLCFAIIAINASPSLRGEMPYLCVANPATLSLCLQCFSLTARYIAILSLLHVLLYLTQQVHSHAFQGHAFAPLI